MSILFDKSLEEVFNEQAFDEAFETYTKEQKGMGTYRIYIYFEYRRSSHWNSPCFIMVTRSNKDQTLNMDAPLFFCDGEKEGEGCGKVLTGEDLLATLESGEMVKVVYCAQCKKYINKKLTSSHLFLNNPKKTIAKRVYSLFCELNRDADIVCIYMNKDIKKANEDWRGEKLDEARSSREASLYPLKNIISDVTAGESSVLRKIEDFLSA
jgi:hypothetical protein